MTLSNKNHHYQYEELSPNAQKVALSQFSSLGKEKINFDIAVMEASGAIYDMGIESGECFDLFYNNLPQSLFDPFFALHVIDGTYGIIEPRYNEIYKGFPGDRAYDDEICNIARGLEKIQIRHKYEIGAVIAENNIYSTNNKPMRVFRKDGERLSSNTQMKVGDLLNRFQNWIFEYFRHEFYYRLGDLYVEDWFEWKKIKFRVNGKCVNKSDIIWFRR